MKSISALYIISCLYILHLACRSARAQYFQQPWRTYENITFDMVNRGSYNISFCVEELINCWEIVKPDMICSWWRYYSSVCTLMRDYCAEFYGDTENYWHKFYLVEGFCYNNWHMSWT